MSSIENKIVSMTFDNKSFERNIAATLATLDDLSESLRNVGVGNGLDTLADSAKDFDVSAMAKGIDSISDKLSIMGAIGFTLIQDLTRSAIDFAQNVGAKVMDPLLFGGKSRAQNIEQAKFLFRGLGVDIELGMSSALNAVKGTAFGLDAAAKAAAQLAGSGLEAGEKMTDTLRGIAGVAAMTNTSFEEMADVFTSAAGKGKVSGYELQRIGQRGLNAAASLAKVWGTTEQEVRRMASEGEISFEKFAEGMNEAFGEHATKANETYTGSLANLNAAISRIGASFFGVRMEQQRDLFNAMTPVVDNLAKAFQPLIDALLEITGSGTKGMIAFLNAIDLTGVIYGFTIIGTAIGNLHKVVLSVAKVFKEAFREIFPKSETSKVLAFALAFEKFTEKIKMGEKTLEKIKSIFRGVFSIFAIGIEIVKEVAKTFAGLLGIFAGGGGESEVLKFFANLGESLVNLKTSLVDGGGIADFFERIRNAIVGFKEALIDDGGIRNFFNNIKLAIEEPGLAIEKLKEKISGLFDGGEGGLPGGAVATALLDRITDRFEMLGKFVRDVGNGWSWLADKLSFVTDVLGRLWDYIREWFSELGQKLVDVLTPSDFDAAVDALNIGLIGGIIYALKKFVQDGKLVFDLTGGFMDGIKGAIEQLTGVLANMQLELKAKALLKIAIAIAVLTGSLLVLSLIDSAALTKALVAMGIGFGQLVAVMKVMEDLDVGLTSSRMLAMATAMILLASAATVLSIAITVLSKLSWSELAKGLIGVTVGLQALVRGMNAISSDTAGLVRTSVAMIGISLALIVLAKAVKAFGELSWSEILKGMVGIAVGLHLLAAATQAFPKGMVAQGAGLILLAAGLYVLSYSVEKMAAIPMGEMAQGLASIGVALYIIGKVMDGMPVNLPITAAGVLILSGAMLIMAAAVEKMGDLAFDTLAKGIGAFAAMLTILALATIAMNGTLAGAAALVVVSGALHILANVLEKVGTLSIQEIILGLTGIALTLIILGTAAAAMQPILPALFGLGVALALIGGSFALFGVGIALVAKGLETMARSGRAGFAAIIESIKMFIALLPTMLGALLGAVVELADRILAVAPLLIKSFTVIMGHILETVIELVPQIAEAISAIITAALKLIRDQAGDVIETGYTILLALLQGLEDHMEEIGTSAVNIIIKFAETMQENSDRIVEAGVNMILAFLSAISERAADIVAAGVALLTNLLLGLSQNVSQVVFAASQIIINFLGALTSATLRIVQAGGAMLRSLLKGIAAEIIKVADTVTDIVVKFITTMGENAGEIAQAGTDALVDFLGGITGNISRVADAIGEVITEFISAVSRNAQKIMDAGTEAVIDFLDGVKKNSGRVMSKFTSAGLHIMRELAKAIVFTVQKSAEILLQFLQTLRTAIDQNAGPIGKAGRQLAGAIINGITGGLAAKSGEVLSSLTGLATDGLKGFGEKLGILSPSKEFFKMGGHIVEGLVKGISSGNEAERNSAELAERTMAAFQDTLRKIPNTIEFMDDISPVITPVLDLSKVEEAAKGIDRMMAVPTIAPEVSMDRARYISHTTETSGEESGPETPTVTEVSFEQNIYSPTALSISDIYRNTKSQIALAKEELNI